MTLLEIRNQIVSCFIEKDTFVIPDDLKKIEVSDYQKSTKLELVQLALSELKEAKFCQAILSLDKEKAVYVLSEPIYSGGQQVMISMPTANAVAETVNTYAESLSDERFICNKMAVTDRDIQFLCIIINNLLQSQLEKDG